MTGRSARRHCERCGECCLGSSPTLQREDARLLREGVLSRDRVYTIRPGELVRDNVNAALVKTEGELLKVRERDGGGGCEYYDSGARTCRIYTDRPGQCAALACWDAAEFRRVYAGPKAARADVVEDPVLLRLITEHEERCSHRALGDLTARIPREGEAAVARVLEMLRFDHGLRQLLPRRLGMAPAELDFFFGRPLTRTIVMYGLQVVREPDGSFLLTRLDPPSSHSPEA